MVGGGYSVLSEFLIRPALIIESQYQDADLVESDGGEVPSSQTEVKSRWGREKRKWESESGCPLVI